MKVTLYENHRVEAFPESPYFKEKDPEERHKQRLRNCELLRASIERHCDAANLDVRFDRVEICSFCREDWEIDPETKEPACCNSAIKEFREEGGLAGAASRALGEAKSQLEAL